MARKSRRKYLSKSRTDYQAMFDEVATLDADLQNPAASGVYTNPDYVIGGRLGYDALEGVYRDTHAYAAIQRLTTALTSYDWTVVPGATDGRAVAAAADATALLERIDFDRVTADMMTAYVFGFSVGEVMIRPTGQNKLEVYAVIPRAARRFAFDAQLQLRLRTKENYHPGKLLDQHKFLVWTYGGRDNNPYGSGIGSKLLSLVKAKRDVMLNILDYTQRIANGVGLAVVDSTGLDEDAAMTQAMDALETLRSSGDAAVTKGIELKILEANGQALQSFLDTVKLLNAEISKCALGQTASLESSPYQSAGVLQTAHTGVLMEQLRSLSDGICAKIDSVIAFEIMANYGPDVAPPRVRRLIGEAEAFATRIANDHKVAALGFEPSEDYVREHYGDYWKRNPDNRKTPPAVAGAIG